MPIARITSASIAPAPIVENQGGAKSLAASLFTRENAIFAAKVACGIVVAGGAAALAGYALESGGIALMSHGYQSLGSYMQVGGHGLFTVGKYTAYTVLVPTYMLCYQLPRWIITTGAPEAARLFRSYVLEPAAEKIQWLANKAVEVITYVHHHVIQPVVDKVVYIFSQYIVPTITTAAVWIKDKIVTVLEFTRDYVLTPLANLARSALELAKQYIFEPLSDAFRWIGNRIVDVIQLANDYIVQPLLTLASKISSIVREAFVWLGTYIRDYIVIPFVDLMNKVAELASAYFFEPIKNSVIWVGNRIVDVIQLANDYIVQPLLTLATRISSIVREAFVWIGTNIRDYIVEPIKNGFIWVGNRIIDVLVFARDTLLPPLEQAANAVWDFAKGYIFAPVAAAIQWAGNRVVDLINLGNDYIVAPMITVAKAIGHLIAQTAGWVYTTVLEPASAAVVSVANSAATLAQTIYTTARNDIYSFLGYQTA